MNNHTELNQACVDGDILTVKRLFEKGIDVTVDDNAAFYMAVQNGNLEVVKYLAAVCREIKVYKEILKMTVMKGFLDVAEYLMNHGAEIDLIDNHCISVASGNGHLETVSHFVDLGVDIHSDNYFGLELAAKNGHLDMVKYLIEQGCDIDLAIEHGDETVVEWAVAYKNSKELSARLSLNLSNQSNSTKRMKI